MVPVPCASGQNARRAPLAKSAAASCSGLVQFGRTQRGQVGLQRPDGCARIGRAQDRGAVHEGGVEPAFHVRRDLDADGGQLRGHHRVRADHQEAPDGPRREHGRDGVVREGERERRVRVGIADAVIRRTP